METAVKEKVKRAPRAKKVALPSVDVAVTDAPPAIFMEEVTQPPIPIAPVVKKKTASRKPPVIASVGPDGIIGSLSPLLDNRPLIAHLTIRSSDIDNDMFAQATETPVVATGQPSAYDPEDTYVNYGNIGTASASASSKKVITMVEKDAVIVGRPSLPLHYSEKLMVRFQDANREQRLPESTEIACFWDCNPFRGQPCVIPTGIEEGIWRVYGNFCCPECAAAFLFNERLDSNVQWERYALLNRLYVTSPLDTEPIRLAPARSALRLFGGNLEVADYRSIVGEKRLRIDVMTPPMISIIQVMDTKPIDFYDAAMKNTFIPWEMDRMNRPGAQGLRLRRTKPVAEKESTLEWCMGITA